MPRDLIGGFTLSEWLPSSLVPSLSVPELTELHLGACPGREERTKGKRQ